MDLDNYLNVDKKDLKNPTLKDLKKPSKKQKILMFTGLAYIVGSLIYTTVSLIGYVLKLF